MTKKLQFEMSCDIAVIGMAVMGRNLAMNAAEKGFQVAVFNRTTSRTFEAILEAQNQGLTLHPKETMEDLVASLKRPRKIIMLVQAGKPVESVIHNLLGQLEPGDILVDGGNEYFENTMKRIDLAKAHGIRYVGMGISGGEDGARYGPSMMPGGDKESYIELRPILEKIAANVNGRPCVNYMGNGAAGHYVKMVHNGIEYGDMELIAEGYQLFRQVFKWDNDRISELFKEWNQGFLASYLMELSAKVLKTRNAETGDFLINSVLDVAHSKGTGKWTMQQSLALQIPCPTIGAALDSRYLSGERTLRERCQDRLQRSKIDGTHYDIVPSDVASALYCAKVCSYTQGLTLLQRASEAYGFDVDLSTVASTWVGGCIIRANFLNDIAECKSENLLLDPKFELLIKEHERGWRKTVATAVGCGVPIPALAASLEYHDFLAEKKLPLDLVQSLRDAFGAHTFEDANIPNSVCHADWNSGKILSRQSS